MENDNDRNRAGELLASLDPPAEWQPNADAAYDRFRSRIGSPRSRGWMWGAIAAGLLLATFITLPPGRAIAQRLWEFVTLSRVEVIRFAVEDLPEDAKGALLGRIISSPGEPRPASNVSEASQRVGYTVRLPRTGLLGGTRAISTLEPLTAELVLDVDQLDRALRRAGATDLTVPRDWNGGRIVVHISKSTITSYQDTTLMQAQPFTISVPPNVELTAFTEVALRILGVTKDPAKQFASRMAANPAWFFCIGQDDKAEIREIKLRSGPATLIRSFDDDGTLQRTEIIWSTADRVYALSGNLSDELTIAVADSVE